MITVARVAITIAWFALTIAWCTKALAKDTFQYAAVCREIQKYLLRPAKLRPEIQKYLLRPGKNSSGLDGGAARDVAMSAPLSVSRRPCDR